MFVAGGGTDEQVAALDAETGEELWRTTDVEDPEAGPTVTDDTLYTLNYGTLNAFDTSNGSRRWSYTFEDDFRSTRSHPVADGSIYFGSDDGTLYALAEPQ